LEILVDANKADEYENFSLAIALTSLRPYPVGEDPHHVQAIKLIVNSKIL
jgi:hypothetical protein